MPGKIIVANCGNEVGVETDDPAFLALIKALGLKDINPEKNIVTIDNQKPESSSAAEGQYLFTQDKKDGVKLDELTKISADGIRAKLSDSNSLARFGNLMNQEVDKYAINKNVFCLRLKPYRVFYTPEYLEKITEAAFELVILVDEYPDLEVAEEGSIANAKMLFASYAHLCFEKAKSVYFASEESYKRCERDVASYAKSSTGSSSAKLFGDDAYQGFDKAKLLPKKTARIKVLGALPSKSFKLSGGDFVPATTASKETLVQRIIRERNAATYFDRYNLGSITSEHAQKVLTRQANDWAVYPGFYFDENDRVAGNNILGHEDKGRAHYKALRHNEEYTKKYLEAFETYFLACGFDIKTGKKLADADYQEHKERWPTTASPLSSVTLASHAKSSRAAPATADGDSSDEEGVVTLPSDYFKLDEEKFDHVLESFIGMTKGNKATNPLRGLTKEQQNAYFQNMLTFVKACNYKGSNEYFAVFYDELKAICAAIEKGEAASTVKDFSAEKVRGFNAVTAKIDGEKAKEAAALAKDAAQRKRDEEAARLAAAAAKKAEDTARAAAEAAARVEAARVAAEDAARVAAAGAARAVEAEREQRERAERERGAAEEAKKAAADAEAARLEAEKVAAEKLAAEAALEATARAAELAKKKQEKKAKEEALAALKLEAQGLVDGVNGHIAALADAERQADGFSLEVDGALVEAEFAALRGENPDPASIAAIETLITAMKGDIAAVKQRVEEVKVNKQQADVLKAACDAALAVVQANDDLTACTTSLTEIEAHVAAIEALAASSTASVGNVTAGAAAVATKKQQISAAIVTATPVPAPPAPPAPPTPPAPTPPTPTAAIKYSDDSSIAIKIGEGSPNPIVKLSIAVAATNGHAPIAARSVPNGKYRVIKEVYKDPANPDAINHKEVVETLVGIIATVSNILKIDHTKFVAEINEIMNGGGATHKKVHKGQRDVFEKRADADISVSQEMKNFSALFQKYAFQCGIYEGTRGRLQTMPGLRLCNIDKEVLNEIVAKKDDIFFGGANLNTRVQPYYDRVALSTGKTAAIIPAEIFNQAHQEHGQKIKKENLTSSFR